MTTLARLLVAMTDRDAFLAWDATAPIVLRRYREAGHRLLKVTDSAGVLGPAWLAAADELLAGLADARKELARNPCPDSQLQDRWIDEIDAWRELGRAVQALCSGELTMDDAAVATIFDRAVTAGAVRQRTVQEVLRRLRLKT